MKLNTPACSPVQYISLNLQAVRSCPFSQKIFSSSFHLQWTFSKARWSDRAAGWKGFCPFRVDFTLHWFSTAGCPHSLKNAWTPRTHTCYFFQIVSNTSFYKSRYIAHVFGFAFLGFSRLLDDHGTLDPRAEGLIGEGRNDLKLKQRVANKSSRRDRNFITTPTSFPSSQKIGILFLCSPT